MRSTRNFVLFVLALPLASPALAGWPFSSEGPRRGSVEWYEAHACDPVGQRQHYRFGKVWPAATRPIGDAAPVVHRFHHNLYWPHPYTVLDRQAVEQVVQQQIVNGWEQATTLYDYHFDTETQSLNSAGRDHLYWIMSTVPFEFRTAYVQASRVDPSLSSVRLANVQSEAARFVGQDQALPVLLRVTTPVGTPAADVDAIFQYRRDNLSPTPVLQSAGGGGGGAEG